MKKSQVGIIFVLLMIFSVTMVSAYTYGNVIGSSQDIINNILEAGAPIIEAILGDYTTNVGNFGYGEILFMKLIIFLILLAVIRTVLDKVPLFKGNTGVITVLAIGISIISVRFMSSSEMLYGVLLPYGAMGIAITTILPVLIFFFFVHNNGLGASGRRLSWIFFLIVFVTLWINRANDIGLIGNQIYGWSTVALIGVIFGDKQIHKYLEIDKLKKMFREDKQDLIADLVVKYKNLEPGIGNPAVDKKRDKLEKRILELGGSINSE